MNSVSSVLSAHCPSVFMSGVGELRQTGWWKLYPDALATNTDASCSESLSLKSKMLIFGILYCLAVC